MTVKRHTLTNALRAAADIYTADSHGQPERIGAQFLQQASEARALADAIEEGHSIQLVD